MKKALLALAIGGFGIGMTEFVIMGILPEVAEALNITIPQAGHFISAYALGVVVGAPLLTIFGNKWPAHKVLLLLMVWFTLFNTLSAFSNSYTLLMISRFLSGLPHGAFFGIGAVVAGKLAKPGKEAQAIAMMFTGLTVANVLGVPLGTWLGQNFNWGTAFLAVGIVGVLAVISIKFWMPEVKEIKSNGFKEDLKVIKKPELWMVILLTTIGTGGFFAWYSYIAPLITDVAGWSEGIVSYAMILAGLGMVAGNFLGAKLAEMFSPINAVIIALILMVIALISNTFLAYDQIGVLVMTFIIPVIAFCIATPIQMAVINSAKGSEMLGSSLNQSAFNMGNASGAYLAGLPIAYGYGIVSAQYVGAVMAGIGILLGIAVVYLRKQRSVQFEMSNS
ncbi:DHA1 family arabinose polymer transporter-like MFS transporter [Christiangramia gaetbulicola]|uniref:DHA1 family arabinose polymer transporter-like MFS transporter n=1 Tax=Christiangramia gaetbulicola TaxID=703340 RepID=A0A2T6AIN6_9FLAO|nr:MFS transporter [Christiangramia gaetbulicola]PTX43688.1 DHA1 family arabinose polymer transporter-like MFS transporter [Christiangramia gaetbulicola]